MQILKFGFFVLLFAKSLALEEEEEEEGDDEGTVKEYIGVHQLERLVELLTPFECNELLVALSPPETKGDTVSLKGSEAKCRKELKTWFQRESADIHYDRLTKALYHIDRADIATELGKNINQDKILNLKRYVEGYHEFVMSLNPQEEEEPETDQKKRQKRASDLMQYDLDLIVERPPVPAYSKSPMDVALPSLYGLLLGFGGTLLIAIFVFYAVLRITCQNQQKRRSKVAYLLPHLEGSY
ncbi:transmembrane and death domain protein 1-like [Corythoichthys intestinalis]|uniref:transmembrane and death domain protein 1-like n=1 Tax=Corythoichthys intestinalis TaxID=161448 RepID=UPI0025A57830|nr:transmembrane and death domain protein 1-like [Corythoichthys intestinalis]